MKGAVSPPGYDAGMPDPATVAVSDDDTETVAWMFHPDRLAWDAVGVTTRAAAAPWMNAGISPRQHRTWVGYGLGPVAAAATVDACLAADARDPAMAATAVVQELSLEGLRATGPKLATWFDRQGNSWGQATARAVLGALWEGHIQESFPQEGHNEKRLAWHNKRLNKALSEAEFSNRSVRWWRTYRPQPPAVATKVSHPARTMST